MPWNGCNCLLSVLDAVALKKGKNRKNGVECGKLYPKVNVYI
jgi:hypothetical protein